MTFLPIVERELRVASRRRGLYWIRFAAGIVAASFCAWVLFVAAGEPQAAGKVSFTVLSWLAFIYATVAGIYAGCDCLSEEKREGTLGLLFLTDLKGYDIVFGKLAACSVNTFYGLLAGIPVLAIPLLLGGVKSIEFWRVALTAMNLLFFFVSVGLFASAVCQREQMALTLAGGLALAFVVGVPLLFYAHSARTATSHVAWLVITPDTACFTAEEAVYSIRPNSEYFWWTVAITHLYGWLFLGAACFLTPRSWQERKVSEKSWRDRWIGFSPARKLALRRTLLESNPFYWRSSRPEDKRLLVWMALALCLGIWAWLCRLSHTDLFIDASMNTVFLVMANSLLKYWIALESAQAFADDRRSGAFELLLSTPITEKNIVHGQNLALWRQFGGPIITVMATHGILLLTVALRSYETHDRGTLGVWYLILAVSLAMDAVALSRWSMWLALAGRKPIRAGLISLAWILIFPSVLFVMGYTVHGLMAPLTPEGNFASFWWCALGLAADLYFITAAQNNLAARFREMATNVRGTSRAKLAAA